MSSCRGTGNHSPSPRTRPPPDCCGAGRPVTIEGQRRDIEMRRFRLEKAAQQPFLTLFGHLAPGVGGRTPEGAVALLLRRSGRRIQADQEEGAVLVVASAA